MATTSVPLVCRTVSSHTVEMVWSHRTKCVTTTTRPIQIVQHAHTPAKQHLQQRLVQTHSSEVWFQDLRSQVSREPSSAQMGKSSVTSRLQRVPQRVQDSSSSLSLELQQVLESSDVGTSNNGAPGRTRTCDQQVRNLLLYPPELREHSVMISISESDNRHI